MVGFSSNKDFKILIKNSMILNFRVTVDDMDRANTIYGPSIANLKGKTTRTKSKPVVTDYVEVPPAVLDSNKDITLSADILFVNHIPFYATTIRHIKFTTVEAIPSQKLPQLIKSNQSMLDLYSQRGFKVTTTLMERELEDDYPLATNNEQPELVDQHNAAKPTDEQTIINPSASTSDTTIDNPSDSSVRRSNRAPKPVNDYETSFLGQRYHSTAATTLNPNFTFATIHGHMFLNHGADWDQVLHCSMTQLSMKAGMRQWGDKI